MKLKIISKDNSEKGSIEMPEQFAEPVRRDLIKRAVIALQMAARQPYGAKPEAGKRASAFISKRRRKYKGTYGIGQSRTPRKVMSRTGTRFFHVGAFAPQTVGGRRAHPPKADKIWDRKINEKENRKAIRSALASTLQLDVVKSRGHKAPDNYPFIIADDFQTIKKTGDLKKVLVKIGLENELKRTSVKKIRPGKGKARGRRKIVKKGALFVVHDTCDLEKSANNVPGFETVKVNDLNAELLAPGAEPGRLTLYTESAIKQIKDKKLFSLDFKGEKELRAVSRMQKTDKKPKKEKKVVKKKTVSKTQKSETAVGDKK